MSEPAVVPEANIDDLARHVGSGGALLDVRNPDEWLDQRVPGALLIPLAELPERVDDVPRPAEDGQLLVICRTGARSARAVAYLRGQGIDAVNVAGGTLAWAQAGHLVTSGPG